MLPRCPPSPRRRRNAAGRTLHALAAGAAAALLALAPPALAAPGVWKCRGSGGVPVYQDRRCEGDAELRDFAVDPPALSVVPPPPAAVPPASRAAPRREARPPPRPRRADAARPTGDAAQRRHVHEGMGEGEVLARLGSPDLVSGKGGRRMRWTYLPAPGDPQTLTTVRFEDGRVLAVERSVVR